ncbi:Fic/DOC family N-terminal domain-containing protein [Candidatus Williamhamiltonella defendens]|nr:Fic/DOC family N-terminal domain-containing protein [Candidatus Hamiltonella defensa]
MNILPILKAKDSSRIENIVTTSDQLFQYVERTDQATKEDPLYRTSMYE